MSDAVITVENVGKCYMVGRNAAVAERNPTLRDALTRGASGYARKTRDILRGRPIIQGQRVEEFWALKDVSFEVHAGDTLGIIGRNGAGKSTVLKILSRITEPTKGRIAITGRVASLLEVGTGFHPELTGRQNIYLNGAILGMGRAEIRRKFDEIVSFAEVEAFLDTPVKRYSSGMYVRLAFAVAAHLEPEILIVDEVLAVGDAGFQKKCLGKMDEFGRQGRTVLFVSHNMAMVSNLCRRGIVLDAGKVEFTGHVSDAVMKYYEAARPGVERTRSVFASDTAELLHSELLGVPGVSEFTIHEDVTVRMRYRITGETDGRCVPNFHFFTSNGTCAFVAAPLDLNKQTAGTYNADCIIPGDFLNEGAYFVGVALTTHFDDRPYRIEFYDRNALTFNVIDPMDEGSDRYSYAGPMPGVVRPQLEWQIEKDSE
jgi:lipopolysaccharide transport system ATP-binding protein